MKSKKENIITIAIINIIIFIINTCLLICFALGSFIGDYAKEVSTWQKYFAYFKGVAVAFFVCLLLNYISVNIINKKEKHLNFIKIIIFPIILVIIQSIVIIMLS